MELCPPLCADTRKIGLVWGCHSQHAHGQGLTPGLLLLGCCSCRGCRDLGPASLSLSFPAQGLIKHSTFTESWGDFPGNTQALSPLTGPAPSKTPGSFVSLVLNYFLFEGPPNCMYSRGLRLGLPPAEQRIEMLHRLSREGRPAGTKPLRLESSKKEARVSGE